jgi:hypothetical protein
MNITDETTRFEMSEEEVNLRAKLVIAEHDLKAYKEAFKKFKETGRPITLPNQLSPEEFNLMIDYMAKQQKIQDRALNRAKRLKKKDNGRV